MATSATTDELFILAMDHRDSLAKDLYGVTGQPGEADAARIAAGKQLVFGGLLAAIERGADRSTVGVLVDERYGAAVATQAREAGLTLAMPIERSGQRVFMLEYGTLAESGWLEHVARFAPYHVKVLVRDNPDADPADRATQFERLAAVSVAAAAQVVAVARDGGREAVRCIVLGRDAPPERLDHWLRVAAATDGFTGFAIGRSIWERPLAAHLAGDLTADQLTDQVATSYLHYVGAYRAAGQAGE